MVYGSRTYSVGEPFRKIVYRWPPAAINQTEDGGPNLKN